MTRMLIVAAAGALHLSGASWLTAVPLAQPEGQPPEIREDARKIAPLYVSSSELRDAKIISLSDPGKKADVVDLVLSTKDGRALYAIVHTRGILGTQERTIALPYGALSWEPTEQSLILNARADQIAALAEIDPKDLTMLRDPAWMNSLRSIFGDHPEFREPVREEGVDRTAGDQYTEIFANATLRTFSGRIVDVFGGDEQSHEPLEIALATDDGDAQRTVLLAPLAHLNEQAAAPTRGASIRVMGVEGVRADGNTIVIAQSFEIDGKQTQLRDEQGVPMWKSDGANSPHVLAKALEGKTLTVTSGDADFGKVDTIAIEVNSGQAAFIISSVGGFLGVGNSRFPIPWPALKVTSSAKLSIDGSETSLDNAPSLSGSGVKDLNEGAVAENAWRHFGLEPQEFDMERRTRWMQRHMSSSDTRDPPRPDGR